MRKVSTARSEGVKQFIILGGGLMGSAVRQTIPRMYSRSGLRRLWDADAGSVEVTVLCSEDESCRCPVTLNVSVLDEITFSKKIERI